MSLKYKQNGQVIEIHDVIVKQKAKEEKSNSIVNAGLRIPDGTVSIIESVTKEDI